MKAAGAFDGLPRELRENILAISSARHANALLRVFVFRYRLKALPSSLRRWAGPPFFHHRGGPSSIRGSRSLPWRVNQHPLGYPSRPSHFVGFLQYH